MSRAVTSTFLGYDHNPKVADGEWYDETNGSARRYPLFAQRVKRGTVQTLEKPLGLLGKNVSASGTAVDPAKGYKPFGAVADGKKLYYNGSDTGLTLDDTTEKQLISMGAYILVFPDKLYFNTSDFSDKGSMEAKFSTDTSVHNATFSLCDVDGKAISAEASSTAPEKPTGGQYWIDTSGTTHALKVYSASSASWTSVATVYVSIACTGIGAQFKVYDGVTVSGVAYTGDNTSLKSQLEALNKTCVIQAVPDEGHIVIIGLLDQTYTQTAGNQNGDPLAVKRSVPDMDYVTESGNRIWGCRFGHDNDTGTNVNEIYCCKLGDFKNWNCFMGLSTDSYSASRGSDGVFTGAVTYGGYPLFFKENCIEKVYPSTSGAHQIVTVECRGVQKGCWKSLCVVGETLLYKSRTDVCAYDGSLPGSVSAALGVEKYAAAAAGAFGGLYYISMKDVSTGVWHLFVYDTEKGLWSREDNTHAQFFSRSDDDLYYIDGDTNKVMSVFGTSGTAEGDIPWSAETGVEGYEYPDQKYLSRYLIRADLAEGAAMNAFLEYDSSGTWEAKGSVTGTGKLRSYLLPIAPRRCDHLRMKLTGTGECVIFSVARMLETGSDCV